LKFSNLSENIDVKFSLQPELAYPSGSVCNLETALG